jgi:hypothetical protein
MSFKVFTQLWTEFFIFHILIRINCNQISKGLPHVHLKQYLKVIEINTEDIPVTQSNPCMLNTTLNTDVKKIKINKCVLWSTVYLSWPLLSACYINDKVGTAFPCGVCTVLWSPKRCRWDFTFICVLKHNWQPVQQNVKTQFSECKGTSELIRHNHVTS